MVVKVLEGWSVRGEFSEWLIADPEGVGLKPLDFSDHKFEFPLRAGMFVSCVCVGSNLCKKLITLSEESYHMDV
jgi:hypothetical protein